MRKSIRTGFFASSTIIAHIRIIFQLFFAHNLIASLIGLLIFFVVFHFFYLDVYQTDNKKSILFILIITLIEVIWLNFFGNGIMIGGLIAMNVTIIYLGSLLEDSANECISFKASSYFWTGGYAFTMGMTIAYSLFTIGIYNTFPFSCNDLNTQSAKFIETITKPFNISWIQNTDNTKILNETKVSDLLSVWKIINIESDIKWFSPLENFKNRKNNLITKTLDENKELNQWICEYSLTKLTEKLKQPEFQVSAIIIMVGIAYPFLRIVIYVMSMISFLLFLAMKNMKAYTIQKVMTEIEKIW